MDLTKPIIEGLFVPVFTPTDKDRNVNIAGIERYIKYLHRYRIKGIVVGGTTGEYTTLSVADRKSVLREWVKWTTNLNLTVIAQIGGVPMPEVIEMAKYAEELEVDGIMTLPEMYYKPKTSVQLVAYLKAISNAAPTLPLIYYHFPMVSGVEVNMREFFQLASSEIPNFVGMKADIEAAVQVSDIIRLDQRVFIGNHWLAPAARLGIESSIATVTNIFPEMIINLIQAHRIRESKLAKDIQKRLNELVAAITSVGDFLPAMKAAMSIVSDVDVGPPRQPLTALSEQKIEELEAKFHRLKVFGED